MINRAAPKPQILLADDQADVLESLRLLLRGEAYQIEAVQSPRAVLEAVERSGFDLILMDLNYARDTTSGREGLDLLAKLQELDSTLPIVVMTAWGSVEVAVEAMRCGARDFIQKPWENQRLLSVLKTQVELRQALSQGRRLEAENAVLRSEQSAVTLIAGSPAMQPVLDLIDRVGPSDANVLVTGEHGTGKEVIARALHAASRRASRSLITVNLGGLSETLFLSELFGHVKRAFTDARADRVGRFELADQGTLFLDEIANIPMGQQANLLRVLETGEMERVGSSRTIRVDTRIISATNSDLKAAVQEGRFREDLLFRLNTINIHLPPLRDRREDIPRLAMHFLGQYSQKYQKGVTRFDGSALNAMARYSWPGNVRELDHVVERSVLMARGSGIQADELGLREEHIDRIEEMTLEDMERLLISRVLRRTHGSISEASAALGLSRSALYRRMEKYGL